MRRLLCRLLGHVRWQRDGRFPRKRFVRGDRTLANGLRDGSLRLGPHPFVIAQQYPPFSRSWLCWRCHDWIHAPKYREVPPRR